MPLGLNLSTSCGDLRKSVLLTTPRRLAHRRQHPQAPLQPLGKKTDSGSKALENGGSDMQASVSAPVLLKQPKAPASTSQNTPSFLATSDSFSSSLRQRNNLKVRPSTGASAISDGSSDGEDLDEATTASRAELVRIRRRLHHQACECQETKQELARVKTELWQVRCEADELRLKLTNLERIDRIKSSELLEERRKNDEMSKQVKEMSANLLSLTGSLDGLEGSGLRKRCFKLVQQNTSLSVEKSLLQRQKGWAEAKARVLQNEVTRCYLGIHDRVKDDAELEQETIQEFAAPQFTSDEPPIYQLQFPCDSVHREAVVDFVTHLTHTGGQDVKGFLQSSRVYSEGIRNDCLDGLAREFYAAWRRNALLPHILRAVERIVHLQDYLLAFESFASEITSLLGCAHAKIWVVDSTRRVMWTCVRDGDSQRSFTLNLPKGRSADLTGQSIAAAAYLMQKPVNVADAREDPRYRPEEEAGPDGHAKSILCVPIAKVAKSKRQPEVRVVLEAVNKLREPHFDPDRDARILKLLGKVSMEVLQVCENTSGDRLNTKRKEVLIQLLIDCTPCTTPTMLLYTIEHGLQDTFLAQAVALHLVVGNSTMLVTMDKHSQRKLVHVASEGMKGIIGLVAKTMNKETTLSSQVDDKSKHDPSVDLPALAKQVIHTVPICEGSGCVAVCQFTCIERDKMMITDDGAYHPESNHHFHLLNLLLTFVQKHLDVVMPHKPQLEPFKPSTPIRKLSETRSSEEPSGEDSESLQAAEQEMPGKRQSRRSVHFPEDVSHSDRESAAVKIQSHQRGRMVRSSRNDSPPPTQA